MIPRRRRARCLAPGTHCRHLHLPRRAGRRGPWGR